MTAIRTLLLFCGVAVCAAAAEGDWTVRDFRFSTGETIPELRLHYTTLGALSGNNAVLILHGTGGTGAQFLAEAFAGQLFGPGQLLDSSRYYIVLPDNVGHGKSTKPSDGLRARFPRYTYEDMVHLQYKLLREGLGVGHLRLVMGTSMGGMHTWLWGEMYPDFLDTLMPLASAPAPVGGLNRIRRKMIIDSIRNDPEWNGGDYKTQPKGLVPALYSLFLMTASPLELYKRAPTRDAADQVLDRYIRDRLARTDANDMLYAFESSRDYDASPDLEKIQARLLAINSADDLVNPPELGIVEREIHRVKRGHFVLLPITDQTRAHGTHSVPAVWKQYLAELLEK